jgi:nucleoside-diphosphate-sugar epimerase
MQDGERARVGDRGLPPAGAESRRVVLTGGSGLVGSRVIGPLTTAGYEVHVLARRSRAGADAIWHQVDLLDERAVTAVVAAIGAEHLLHLAWYTEHGSFWDAPANLDWVAASLRLLRAFVEHGGRRAVLAGSCAEYDWGARDDRYREVGDGESPATALRPATLYGAAKHATHLVAAAFAAESKLSLAWGRIFFLYGPGEDERRLVPQVTRALLSKGPAATGDGGLVRDFMHVDDVARGFAALLDSSVEGPVNIASGEPVTIGEMAELIARTTGHPELLRLGTLPRRPGEPERLVADVRRLRTEVGFAPALTLADGIAATVDWWRGQDGRLGGAAG